MLNIVYAEFCVFIVMLTVLLLSVVVPVTVLARDNWNLTLVDNHIFAYLFIPPKQNKGNPCKDLYTRNWRCVWNSQVKEPPCVPRQ